MSFNSIEKPQNPIEISHYENIINLVVMCFHLEKCLLSRFIYWSVVTSVGSSDNLFIGLEKICDTNIQHFMCLKSHRYHHNG